MTEDVPSYIRKRLDFGDLTSSLALLRLLAERGAMSQPEAAAALEMSTGACNLHFQRLAHEGLIRCVDKIRAGRGRPTLVWDLNHAANACVTIIFDVPFMQVTMFDFGGRILVEDRLDLSSVRNRAAVTRRLDRFLERVVKMAAGQGIRVRQAFAAMPGILDTHSGSVVQAVNFPALNGLNVQEVVAKHGDWPCYIGPLGLAFYYGESEAAETTGPSLLIHWDLGIGALCGEGPELIRYGSGEKGGHLCWDEFGHTRLNRPGPDCHCGRNGCLEAHVGGWAILRNLNDPAIRTLADLASAADRKSVRQAVSRAASIVGEELTWPVQLLRVRNVIITGPMAPMIHDASDAIREGLGKAIHEADEMPAVHVSLHPEKSMQRGAFEVAKRLYLYPGSF